MPPAARYPYLNRQPARPFVDARGTDAKGARLRSVGRDINGKIVSGKDVLTGDKMQPQGQRGMMPPMTAGMQWLKENDARKAALNRQAAQAGVQSAAQSVAPAVSQGMNVALSSLPGNLPVPQRIPTGSPVVNDGAGGRSVVTRQPSTGTTSGTTLTPDMAARAAGIRQRLVAEGRIAPDGTPQKPAVSDMRPQDSNPHGQAYMAALSRGMAAQTQAEMAGRASGAGYQPQSDTDLKLAAERETAPQNRSPSMASVPNGASRVVFTDPKFGGTGVGYARTGLNAGAEDEETRRRRLAGM